MSRIGRKSIIIAKGVEVTVSGCDVFVKGPKGILSLQVKEGVEVTVDEDTVVVSLASKYEHMKNFHGLYRALINNMVVGVSEGFKKDLEMIGVGYRAAVKGEGLDLQIGCSHPTVLEIPTGISVTVEKNVKITVSGSDKQAVGQFAATIRSKRPPEPYKGKGIKYVGEYIRRKAGKSGKS